MNEDPTAERPILRMYAFEKEGLADEHLDVTDVFTVIYRRYVERVYRYHLARIGHVQDAQDLTAETFRSALEGFARYQVDKGSPLAWIMGIARHKAIDYFRAAPKEMPLEQAANSPEQGKQPEEIVEHRLDLVRVAEALRQLTPARSEALALHFFAGLSLAEVGQVMSKKPAAVKKLVQRGLADLRIRLSTWTEVDG
jgi:RNA polymerase sigma-70 factor (ECF subfamily)